jgi:hypothetical protein
MENAQMHTTRGGTQMNMFVNGESSEEKSINKSMQEPN